MFKPPPGQLCGNFDYILVFRNRCQRLRLNHLQGCVCWCRIARNVNFIDICQRLAPIVEPCEFNVVVLIGQFDWWKQLIHNVSHRAVTRNIN